MKYRLEANSKATGVGKDLKCHDRLLVLMLYREKIPYILQYTDCMAKAFTCSTSAFKISHLAEATRNVSGLPQSRVSDNRAVATNVRATAMTFHSSII